MFITTTITMIAVSFAYLAMGDFGLPEAHHRAVFTDITFGLVSGRFRCGDSMKHR